MVGVYAEGVGIRPSSRRVVCLLTIVMVCGVLRLFPTPRALRSRLRASFVCFLELAAAHLVGVDGEGNPCCDRNGVTKGPRVGSRCIV